MNQQFQHRKRFSLENPRQQVKKMQNHSQQFFKVLPSSSTETKQKPSLQSYRTVLQVLKNRNYLYVDFNQKQQDSLLFLQKTPSPIENIMEEPDDEDLNENLEKDIESLGNQYIMNTKNLSPSSYKMMRYVSQGKKLMKKKKHVDELQTSFIKNLGQKDSRKLAIRFGPGYRKLEERNKKLLFHSKIQPDKLQEYLENKNYRKVEKRLQKSEQQLQKNMVSMKELKERQRETIMSRILSRADSPILQRTFGYQLQLSSRYGSLTGLPGRNSLMRGESQSLSQISRELVGRVKFPKICRLSKALAETFTAR